MVKLYKNVDVINTALIILSLGIACIIPFELFLLAYGVLGPLHYLTEISWLRDRNYFLKKPHDIKIIFFLIILILFGSPTLLPFEELLFFQQYSGLTIYLSLSFALIFVLTDSWQKRIDYILLALIGSIILMFPIGIIIFVGLLPTLIHVYLFTGLFMLSGVLKSKNIWGLISVIALLLSGILCFLIPSNISITPGIWAIESYKNTFGSLSELILHDILNLKNFDIFNDPLSIKVGRFIAFAYTYHYLNWFSKTSVINWHKVSKIRMTYIISMWLIFVGFYFYDYVLGFKLLFILSLSHVILEFPLNSLSFLSFSKYIKKNTRMN